MLQCRTPAQDKLQWWNAGFSDVFAMARDSFKTVVDARLNTIKSTSFSALNPHLHLSNKASALEHPHSAHLEHTSKSSGKAMTGSFEWTSYCTALVGSQILTHGPKWKNMDKKRKRRLKDAEVEAAEAQRVAKRAERAQAAEDLATAKAVLAAAAAASAAAKVRY